MMGMETIKSNLATCESQSLRPAVLHRRLASRRSSTELFLSSDANKLTFSEPAEGHCMGSVLWLFWGEKRRRGEEKQARATFCFEALNQAALSQSGTEAFKSTPLFPQKDPYIYEAGGKSQWKKDCINGRMGQWKDVVFVLSERREEKKNIERHLNGVLVWCY